MSGSIAKKAKGRFNPFPEQNEAPQPNENKEAGQKSTLKKSLTGLGSKPAVSKKEGTEDDSKSARHDKQQKKSSVRWFHTLVKLDWTLTDETQSKCVAF